MVGARWERRWRTAGQAGNYRRVGEGEETKAIWEGEREKDKRRGWEWVLGFTHLQ